MTSPPIRRRLIEESDLAAVAALLAEGFPEHGAAWWRRGFALMSTHGIPHGAPRYGRLLTCGEDPVGALVTIHATVPGPDGEDVTRCNLSSWHTRPAFAGYAPLLLGAALRDRTITYLNISPAAHTRPIVEAQGFRPFTQGSLATFPLFSSRPRRSGVDVAVRPFRRNEANRSRHHRIAADHAALGCLCLSVEAPGGPLPFVFSRPRRIGRFVPARHLLYCQDIADFSRHAAALGAALLRRGTAAVLVDGIEAMPGVPGRPFNQGQSKYVAGPNPPRPGDLAYTELAFFG